MPQDSQLSNKRGRSPLFSKISACLDQNQKPIGFTSKKYKGTGKVTAAQSPTTLVKPTNSTINPLNIELGNQTENSPTAV